MESVNATAVIGLEIHARVKSGSKLFCNCKVRDDSPPNTDVCPICTGFPGILPRLNPDIIAKALDLAIALNMTIHTTWQFVRKNYFYPDLPKGYQITMTDHPVASNGQLCWTRNGRSGIVHLQRLHLEEDAGRLIHDEAYCPDSTTLVDYNRAGVPLLELVTEPRYMSVAEVDDMLHYYQALLRTLHLSDADMEKGHLRMDVNISLPPADGSPLCPPVEVKNLNSFHHTRKAIRAEIKRQTEHLKYAGELQRDTRRFNSETGTSERMRLKETVSDYRYFPEPDIPSITISGAYIESRKKQLPELPSARRQWLVDILGIKAEYADVLVFRPRSFDFFRGCLQRVHAPEAIAQYLIQTEPRLRSRYPEQKMPSMDSVCRLLTEVISGSVGWSHVRDICEGSMASRRDLVEVLDEFLESPRISNEEIAELVQLVLSDFPEQVRAYQTGKRKLFGFFMGRVMAAAEGTADPLRIRFFLEQYLNS